MSVYIFTHSKTLTHAHRMTRTCATTYLNVREQIMEMHPAVQLRSRFTPHAVNIMSHHEHVIMLIDVTCQIGCVVRIMAINNFKIYVSFSVDMH